MTDLVAREHLTGDERERVDLCIKEARRRLYHALKALKADDAVDLRIHLLGGHAYAKEALETVEPLHQALIARKNREGAGRCAAEKAAAADPERQARARAYLAGSPVIEGRRRA